jgi:predicted MFS family arabinose efflux permease
MSEPVRDRPHPAESFDRTGIILLIVLCLAMFISGMNVMGLQPFFVDVGRDLGASVPAVGQAMTITLLVSAISGLIAGPVADHFGHRRLMITGGVILTISAIGAALATNLFLFMGARFLAGMSLALLNGLSLAIAGSYFGGEARRRALSVTVAAMSGTAILGVPLLSWLGDVLSWRWAFAFTGMTALALTPFLYQLIPSQLSHGSAFRLGQIISAYRPLLRQRSLLAVYVGSFVRAIFWLGILTYFGSFMIEQHGMGLQEVGLTYMVGGIGFLAGSVVAGGRLGQMNHRVLFTIVTLLGALLFGLTYSAPVGPWIAVLLLTGGGFFGAIGWVILNTMLANESKAGSGTTMSLNTAIFNLGSAAGGAVGGAVLAFGTYSAVGLVLPLFAVIASAIVLASSRLRDDETPEAGGQPASPQTSQS